MEYPYGGNAIAAMKEPVKLSFNQQTALDARQRIQKAVQDRGSRTVSRGHQSTPFSAQNQKD